MGVNSTCIKSLR